MANRVNFLTSSLRTKVLVPVIAVLISILAMTIWFVDYRLKQQIEIDAREALNTDDVVFRKLQANHLNYLRLRFQSLANEPKNRSAFGTHDFNTIQKQLASILDEESALKQNAARDEKLAFALFTPADGPEKNKEPMIQPPNNGEPFVAACATNVARALHPDNETSLNLVDTVAVGGKLYNLISISVDTPEHIPIGILTFGEEIGDVTAQEYGTVTGKPIVFIAGGKPVASTLPGKTDDFQMESLFRQLNVGTSVARVALAKEHYFCAVSGFTSLKGDSGIGYLLFNSYDPSASAVETQQLLLAACIIAIIIGSVIVWFFVQRATAPLLELRDSAEAVGRGDFSRRVAVHSRDECGELAKTFNQMTENIRSAQAQLQQTVTTLKTTQAQLVQSEKLSAVGEFVAGVAHELNNPLAAVMGFSELLKDAPVDEKHRRHLDLIFKSSQRCRKIVQSLLSFARRHQPERKPVVINLLIEEVLEIVAYQLRTSNVEVVCRLAADLPLTLADGHQVQQVLLNLINNARQAIEAHQESGRITITTERSGQFIRITIQDNGPGISPENMRRIFDPFFTTKEVGKGTGLGLSLCYGLIKEHGGDIIVTSQPGHGATFTIALPATEGSLAADVANPGDTSVNPQEGAGKIILLVDDENILLEMIRDDLQRHGYEVIIANNGEAAFRELQMHEIDAICCDIKMPGLNGRQVYDRISTSQPKYVRRIIFMTGDVINQSLQYFLEQEHLACLNKPFPLRDLRAALRAIFSKI